jgi:hypothetical protein
VKAATGLALVIGLLGGVLIDDGLRQAQRIRYETARQVMLCLKGDRQ